MKTFNLLIGPFLLSELVFFIFCGTVFYLDGYHHVSLLFYGFLLFTFFQVLLFLYAYFRQKNLWNFLKGDGSFLNIEKDSSPFTKKMHQSFQQELAKKEEEIHQLTKKQQQQQAFTELWIHQMKTPVTIIDLLLQEPQVNKKILQSENERLKEGLDLALNHVRVENFSEDFHLQPVHLKKVCQQAITEQKQTFISKEIFPTVTISDELVVTDEKWLLFILHQLLANSLKYSPQNSKLELFTKKLATSQQLIIKDYGWGIPAKDLLRVTRPFFTGENGRKNREATGMGLYLVAEISKKLNLSLEIESTEGKGTSVTLTFPN